MRKIENFHLLVMLILLVAVGQMAQTIYVPVIADIAHDLSVRTGAVQRVMAAYLMTYGFSQLIYGPLSDRIGRRPVILAGMMIFLVGALGALLSSNLTMLVAASAIQGMGTGVAGVMARTMPRDLYAGTALRYANSLLNMGILVSPLLAPVIGGALAMVFGWRACYAFLLVLCAGVAFAMFRWLPETRPALTEKRRMLASFRQLLTDSTFSCYLVMLIGALAGIAVFEASCGVLRRLVRRARRQDLPQPDVALGDQLPVGGADDVDPRLVRGDEYLDADRAGSAVLLRRRHAVSVGHHRGDGAVPLSGGRCGRTGRWHAEHGLRPGDLAFRHAAADRAVQPGPADVRDGAADFAVLVAAVQPDAASGTHRIKSRAPSAPCLITAGTHAAPDPCGPDSGSNGCGGWCGTCRGSAGFQWWPYCPDG